MLSFSFQSNHHRINDNMIVYLVKLASRCWGFYLKTLGNRQLTFLPAHKCKTSPQLSVFFPLHTPKALWSPRPAYPVFLTSVLTPFFLEGHILWFSIVWFIPLCPGVQGQHDRVRFTLELTFSLRTWREKENKKDEIWRRRAWLNK